VGLRGFRSDRGEFSRYLPNPSPVTPATLVTPETLSLRNLFLTPPFILSFATAYVDGMNFIIDVLSD
jgi:hypothetical protein